jgi:hypothetical protein
MIIFSADFDHVASGTVTSYREATEGLDGSWTPEPVIVFCYPCFAGTSAVGVMASVQWQSSWFARDGRCDVIGVVAELMVC